jgi:ketosteroid isomerase-like protein
MKKTVLLLFLMATVTVYGQKKKADAVEKEKITKLLDEWHAAAARADFNAYFGKLTENSIFIGTDATENWNKKQFEAFSKPYFDKGKAWNFKALERNIFLSDDGKLAWFDELLDTQMKICRGFRRFGENKRQMDDSALCLVYNCAQRCYR